MKNHSLRDRLMLAGLFLSKFDREGLKHLNFSTFREAFNVLGYAMGGKPTSIKNYMQEFDPAFPNRRKGWGDRPMRHHCRLALERFGSLSIEDFSRVLSSELLPSANKLPNDLSELAPFTGENIENDVFAKRVATGAAAESFFEASFPKLEQFREYDLTNVSLLGCGFDFRLQARGPRPFEAVEVKGMNERAGSITMTSKEYRVAEYLADRFWLCVVSNFSETPHLSLIQNPIHNGPEFTCRQRVEHITSWHAKISA